MSDSDLSGGVQEPLFGTGEMPAGFGMLGFNSAQSVIDEFGNTVSRLDASMTSFANKLDSSAASGLSSGVGAGAQNRGTGATGTDRSGGGYVGMLRSFFTFGQRGGGPGVGSGGGTVGGSGGGRMSTFGSGGGVNGQPGGGGAGSGGWRGALATGADVLGVAGAYGDAHMNTFMTMNTAGTQAMWRSGLASGGVNQSLGTATQMIFGTAGGFQNVTAASAGDAARANGILGYTAGVGMYGVNGAPNPTYQAAQANMFAMGYANPYMTQTQIAGAMQSIYSPNSIRAMSALGVSLPKTGFVGPQNYSPMQIAQSVFSRTFGGASSVNASTMTAATGQGGSLNANLTYLGQQAGWSSGTVSAMETYLQQRNSAIQRGLPADQVDSLLSQASSGNKSAAATLQKYGIGASTVQSVKTLQAAQTSNLADQSGGFNDAIQESTSLLTEFNQVLGQLLSSTGMSGAMGSLAGYGSMFGSMAGAASYMAGSGGAGGGMGFVGGGMGGGPGGMLGGIGVNMGMNYAMGRASRWGAGRITSGWNALRNRFGRSAQADAESAASESESAVQEMLPGMEGAGEAGADEAAVAGGGISLGMAGAGLGLTYLGTHLNNALWNSKGHTGPGDDWATDVSKGAGNTLAWAGGGALVGTAIAPGIGTVVGAGVGAAIGLGQSIWDWATDKSGYSAASSSSTGANTASPVLGGYSSGLGNGFTTGSIGGGTDEGTTGTSGPSSISPAPGASNATAATIQKIIAFGLKQVGKPYVYGATGPDSYDCSGLMMASYAAGGIKLPRTSEQQMTAGSPVKPSEALPGDLLFPYPGHVMMCIGGGQVVEARHTGTKIWVRNYSPGEFQAARRIISVGGSATQDDAASGGNAATPGNATSAMSSGLVAGTSELEALQANAMSATVDQLTASLRMTAATAPFGASMLTGGLNAKNPFAGTAAGASGSSGSTALTGTVKDHYGHTYKIPSGAKPSGSVASWINQALTAMGMPQSADTIGDIKTIITGESGGDPWSINLDDSNAAAGHPSEGIMQTIPSTFNAYAMAGHKDIWNPVDNIIAGSRYAISRYKSLDNVPGVKAVKAGKPYVGYFSGAWDIAQDQDARVHQHEMVLPARIADAFRAAVNPGAQSNPQASTGAVALHFRPGAIQVNIGGQVSAGTAQQVATAIVDGIASDPRIKQMAVGL